MAASLHIAGPVTITYDGEDVGRTDGNVLGTVTMIEPSEKINDDSAGGMAVDEVTKDSYALVSLVLQARDEAILNKLRARLKGYQTLAGEGEAQRPGYLRRADNSETRTLKLTPTKLTANSGLKEFEFHDAIADDETDIEIREIGNKASLLAITMKCYSKNVSGTWKVYTRNAISGS